MQAESSLLYPKSESQNNGLRSPQPTIFWLYCIEEADARGAGPCKVGVATHLNKRLSSLQGGNWRPLSIVWKVGLIDRDAALQVEAFCLQTLRPSVYGGMKGVRRLKSEWLDATPEVALERARIVLDALKEEGVLAA